MERLANRKEVCCSWLHGRSARLASQSRGDHAGHARSGRRALHNQLDAKREGHLAVDLRHELRRRPVTPSTADRIGGNRSTAYNWETNASNAGSDWYFENDGSSNTRPGAAILPTLQADAAAHRSLIVTVPMAGYVAGDTAGPVQLADVASLTRFKQVVAKKSSIYSGAQANLSLTPDKTDNYVFTDEYVNWVESNKAAGQQVFYDLDNEPGLWGEPLPSDWTPGVPPCSWCSPPTPGVPHSPQGRTHGEVHPYAPTYAEMRQKTIDHAGAIKDVNPNALVFGGVGYGWNDFVNLQALPMRTPMCLRRTRAAISRASYSTTTICCNRSTRRKSRKGAS